MEHYIHCWNGIWMESWWIHSGVIKAGDVNCVPYKLRIFPRGLIFCILSWGESLRGGFLVVEPCDIFTCPWFPSFLSMETGWWFGTSFIFAYIGNAIIPTDYCIFFSEGLKPLTRCWIWCSHRWMQLHSQMGIGPRWKMKITRTPGWISEIKNNEHGIYLQQMCNSALQPMRRWRICWEILALTANCRTSCGWMLGISYYIYIYRHTYIHGLFLKQ